MPERGHRSSMMEYREGRGGEGGEEEGEEEEKTYAKEDEEKK